MAPLKPASVNKRGNALATKTPASKTKISAVHDEFDFENELPQAERTPRPQSPSGDGRDDIQSLLGLISERLSTRMDSRKRKLNEMTDNIMSNANEQLGNHLSAFQQGFEQRVQSYQKQFAERQSEYDKEIERLRALQQTYQQTCGAIVAKMEQINKQSRAIEASMWKDLEDLNERRKSDIVGLQASITKELRGARGKLLAVRDERRDTLLLQKEMATSLGRRNSARYFRKPQRLEVDARSPVLTVNVLVEQVVLTAEVNASRTVEQLARHVEAVYKEQNPDKPAIHCCLFMDEESVPLSFSEEIGSLIVTGATVIAVSEEDRSDDASNAVAMQLDELAIKSSSTLSSLAEVEEVTHISDADFINAMHNRMCLTYFRDFCTSEYALEDLLFWLDVETFRALAQSKDARRLEFAQRIYLHFLAEDAPLGLNLEQDVRNAITYPVESAAVDMYDDAQAHIQTMLKAHSFKRFLQSSKFREYEAAKNADVGAADCTQTENIGAFFASRITPEQPAAAEEKPDRHATLSKAVKRYWLRDAVDQDIASGDYSEAKEQLASQQRRLRFQKEKKLIKFFGDRPSEAHMELQRSREHLPTDVDLEDAPAAGDVDMSEGDEGDVDAAAEHGAPSAKKRKADKLGEFFGDRLPTPQLAGQRLVTGVAVPVDSSEDLEELPPTTNELTSDEKKTMTRRTRKLQDILGQPIGEERVPVQGKATGSSALSNGTQRIKGWLNSVDLGKFGRSTESDADASIAAPMSPSLRHPSVEDLQRLVAARSRSSSMDALEQERLTKEYRQRRLSKLQNFLGERLAAQELMAQGIVDDPQDAVAATVALAGDDRRQQQRRMNKLERVFGQMPPRELIINQDDPWPVRNKKVLKMLTFLLEHDIESDLEQLIDFMADVDATYPPPATEAESDKVKTVRLKKINKLNKFFGDTMSQEIQREQAVLSELLESYEEAVEEDERFSELKDDVESLKLQVHRRASIQSNAPLHSEEEPVAAASGVQTSTIAEE